MSADRIEKVLAQVGLKASTRKLAPPDFLGGRWPIHGSSALDELCARLAREAYSELRNPKGKQHGLNRQKH